VYLKKFLILFGILFLINCSNKGFNTSFLPEEEHGTVLIEKKFVTLDLPNLIVCEVVYIDTQKFGYTCVDTSKKSPDRNFFLNVKDFEKELKLKNFVIMGRMSALKLLSNITFYCSKNPKECKKIDVNTLDYFINKYKVKET